MSPWPEDWTLYARKSDILYGLKVTSEYCSYNYGAHNVYYVKWWAETRKPLVIYVKTEKTFSPMPFIVYVVYF
ncbi:hypothetical protein KO48_000858 [Salmonella enterica subsp. enterica serovar Bredeney]|nr:hypothetical protein [Salmonella enterica subsp. enterica serovar Bredeney]